MFTQLKCLLVPLAALFWMPLPAHAASPAQARVGERSPDPAQARGAVAIRVQPGAWGAADERDIARVLSFVADILAPAFPRHAGDKIEIVHSSSGPSTDLERLSDGAYRVYLKVQDTRWDQFTYQFSHEYCHIVTNAEQRIHQDSAVRGTQWFEESMCEAVSLLALQRVAARWEQAAPVTTVTGYAGAFRDYAGQLIGQSHRHLPAGAPPDRPLESWYADNRLALQLDPYLRARNEVVASALYAWLAGSEGALAAIGYIGVNGLREAGDSDVFPAYLERWRAATPEHLRANVVSVPALFGYTGPGVPRTRVVER